MSDPAVTGQLEPKNWILDFSPKLISVGPTATYQRSLAAEVPQFCTTQNRPECTCVYCRKKGIRGQSILDRSQASR